MVASACSIIWCHSSYEDNRITIAEEGGTQAVVLALLGHLDDGFIQKEAMICIKNLATKSVNKKRFRQHGCEMALLLSMQANYNSPAILDEAFSAYNNVVVDIAERTVERVPPPVFDCVLRAMARFPKDRGVQESACFFLKSLTFDYSNIAFMQQRRDEFVELLTIAAANHPQDCQDKASEICSKI